MRFTRVITTTLLVASIVLINLDANAGLLKERKFKPLFNGTDLSGWRGATDGYLVKEGEITTKDAFAECPKLEFCE